MNDQIQQLERYVRATNYLTVAQIYLQKNQLLERSLTPDDIKPRLLGHWGTCPGINFVYAHLNRLINQEEAEMLFVLGPGHGFPALQANLFLEGTLGDYYPEATRNAAGIEYLTKQFSWPGGFPSHTNPGTPGAILEGGELGYSLATAYGSVLDNPDLITACVIGDGEAETGPLSAAWQLVRYVDPATNGAVLPILHLNGYKISQQTTFGRMTDDELRSFFRGVGYLPLLVDSADGNVHQQMIEALDAAYEQIRTIQADAQAHSTGVPWPLPVLIVRTPKGWTGPKTLDGMPIEGTWRSHQVVAPEARTNPKHLATLEAWLRSYQFEELFTKDGDFAADVTDLVPPEYLRMGQNEHAFGAHTAKPLELPDTSRFSEDATTPGSNGSSSMRRAGAYLADVFRLNAEFRNVRFFSPDETYSNKLDEIFTATKRAFVGPMVSTDVALAPDGRALELLSEHTLQGVMQGYALTGRYGIFTSYEAFAPIITSMLDQYAKFLKVAAGVRWRSDVPPVTYILTSSGWRQEHNGFSHQNPGFIDDVLRRHAGFVRVFLPPDGNSTLAVLRHSLAQPSGINVIVAGKTVEPRWLTPQLADQQLETGLMTWDFASDENPDLVFLGAGDYMTKECLAAIQLLKRDVPHARFRFVNLVELSRLSPSCEDRLSSVDLQRYLTPDKPIVANFHGYPETLGQLLFGYDIISSRISIHGYIEQGSTTTPFDMQVLNQTSRYHLAIEAAQTLAHTGVLTSAEVAPVIDQYRSVLDRHYIYVRENGVDLPEVEDWQWIPRD